MDAYAAAVAIGALLCVLMPAVLRRPRCPTLRIHPRAQPTSEIVGVRCEQARGHWPAAPCRDELWKMNWETSCSSFSVAARVVACADGLARTNGLVARTGFLVGRGCLSLRHQLDCLVDQQFGNLVVFTQQREPHADISLAPIVVSARRHTQPRIRPENLLCSKTFPGGCEKTTDRCKFTECFNTLWLSSSRIVKNDT